MQLEFSETSANVSVPLDVALPGLKTRLCWMQMASNRRVEMRAWLIVASDVVMTQQVPQNWLLEKQYIQMEYVEHSTTSLSHHGIFSRQDRTKIFTKMFGYTECKCLLSSLFESFPL